MTNATISASATQTTTKRYPAADSQTRVGMPGDWPSQWRLSGAANAVEVPLGTV